MSTLKRWPRAAAVLLLAALAVGASSDDVLTTADVVRFLRAGISERTIITELQTRGFGEELDAAREATLRQAGATETLVVAVRRVAPGAVPAKGAAPATTAAAPGGAVSGGSRGSAFPASSGGRSGLTFGATARSVRVPVSVLDKRGEPILGLRSQDFRVTEDGRSQPVTYFSGERKPLRIALALDLSGSMQSKMREVSDALQYFINLLEPADEIMVITFNDVVTIDQDFTSDRDLLDRLFDRLQPSGGTALYDAAVEAIRRVAPLPAESKAVVLVTDGVDMGSSARYDDLLQIARQSEVPVFSLGIDGQDGMRDLLRQLGGTGGRGPGGGWPRRPGGRGWPGGGGGGGWPGGGGGFPGSGGRGGMGGVREFDARPLMDLADETGGRAEIIKANDGDAIRSARLKQAVESIAVTLRHRYLVGYEPEGSKRGWRKIKVDVERPQVKIQARKGYYAEG